MTDGTLADALGAGGWRVDVLDLHGVTGKAAFMDRCARVLGLPDWFGRNWDALADCLGDPDWGPADPGRLLVVTGWQDYARTRPDEWEIAQEVFASATGRTAHSALAVVLALAGTDQWTGGSDQWTTGGSDPGIGGSDQDPGADPG